MVIQFIQITKRGKPWLPSDFQLRPDASSHVLAQVGDVFVCHPKLDVHEEHAFISGEINLSWGNDLELLLLTRPDDTAAINRIARESIEFPAEDAMDLPIFHALQESRENRAPRLLGRL
ncbi:MAG: hypothetical protein Q7S96_04035 [bacterium]|nr:hypothetical protein [bacterium]